MIYTQKTKDRVKAAGRGIGAQLGRLAVKHNVSVGDIAAKTGASRVTVYSWIAGGNVTNAYKPIVQALIKKLQKQ